MFTYFKSNKLSKENQQESRGQILIELAEGKVGWTSKPLWLLQSIQLKIAPTGKAIACLNMVVTQAMLQIEFIIAEGHPNTSMYWWQNIFYLNLTTDSCSRLCLSFIKISYQAQDPGISQRVITHISKRFTFGVMKTTTVTRPSQTPKLSITPSVL